MQSATIFSVYMSNVEQSVVKSQASVVNRFLPEKWLFKQYLFDPIKEQVAFHHATAIEHCLSTCDTHLVIFLDIDCIPISELAFTTLADHAEKGVLTRCVHRANHIQNNAHLYTVPFSMAYS